MFHIRLRQEHWMFLPWFFFVCLLITFVTYHIEVFVYRKYLENTDLRPKCNGYWWLCSRKYSDVAYATTHNSFSVGEHMLAHQRKDITTQLGDGIRGMVWAPRWRDPKKQDAVDLCSKKCRYEDGGSLYDNLIKLKTWLEANPREVVTLFLKNQVSIEKIASVFNDADMVKYAWVQSLTSTSWPTLQTMIDKNKRLVVFIDVDVDYSRWPWLLREWDFVFETASEIGDTNDFQDPSVTCTVDKPRDTVRSLSVLNHFITTSKEVDDMIDTYPDKALSEEANAYPLLLQHATQCLTSIGQGPAKERGIKYFPNFVVVDFYDLPTPNVDYNVESTSTWSVVEVVKTLNNDYYTA